MEFSGKELIKGEPDASSFPSGGLRATSEARGYTAWDHHPYAFVKETISSVHPHCVLLLHRRGPGQKDPAAALHGGHQPPGLRILRLFGNTDVDQGHPHRGPRAGVLPGGPGEIPEAPGPDLCGRTLFGSPPQGPGAGGPLLRRHPGAGPRFYEGPERGAVEAGHPATTQHNEVAPAQHEMAPHLQHHQRGHRTNQLTMETMKRVADPPRPGLPAP